MKLFVVIALVVFNLSVRAGDLVVTNTAPAAVATNTAAADVQRAEQIRAECLQGRRLICGKILRVLPDGLVVDSGYTDLLRTPLSKSWLVPGSVTANRPANLIESREPESVCVGVVFLTDPPKGRGPAVKPRQYDYVVLMAYPTGQCTYTSVGTVRKTVRRFSTNLLKAVRLNFAAESSGTPAAGVK